MALQTSLMAGALWCAGLFVAACPANADVGGIIGSNNHVEGSIVGGSVSIGGGTISGNGGTAKAKPKNGAEIKNASVVVFRDENKNGKYDKGEPVDKRGSLTGSGEVSFSFGNISWNLSGGAPTCEMTGSVQVGNECKPFQFSENLGNLTGN
jgi:hypothetical protein